MERNNRKSRRPMASACLAELVQRLGLKTNPRIPSIEEIKTRVALLSRGAKMEVENYCRLAQTAEKNHSSNNQKILDRILKAVL